VEEGKEEEEERKGEGEEEEEGGEEGVEEGVEEGGEEGRERTHGIRGEMILLVAGTGSSIPPSRPPSLTTSIAST